MTTLVLNRPVTPTAMTAAANTTGRTMMKKTNEPCPKCGAYLRYSPEIRHREACVLDNELGPRLTELNFPAEYLCLKCEYRKKEDSSEK